MPSLGWSTMVQIVEASAEDRAALVDKLAKELHEDGAIREAFRTLHPRGGRKPMRAFSFLEVEEEPGETVDLATLAKGERNER